MSAAPGELIRILYRDPEHLCERLTLFACHRLAEPSRDWPQRSCQTHPDPDLREIAQRLGVQSMRIARLEGAIAGTPFYVALVPGYLLSVVAALAAYGRR